MLQRKEASDFDGIAPTAPAQARSRRSVASNSGSEDVTPKNGFARSEAEQSKHPGLFEC